MTDSEFDALDELYFIISYEQLLNNLNWEKIQLNSQIKNLLDKKWVKAYNKQNIIEVNVEIESNQYCNYLYLATKTGLLAHNSK